MKIGIFGGCFNPPHYMHKVIAQELIKQGCLDKVIFVPTGNNYGKKELIDIDYRLDMLKLVIDNETMQVSDISKDLKFQYTFEILDYFKAKYMNAEIYFICGTDNLNEFNKWKNYEYILSNYKLLVIVRNGDNIQELLSKYANHVDKICVANIIQNQISSTTIRNCIKEGKIEETRKYIEEAVVKYIQDKDLYKN